MKHTLSIRFLRLALGFFFVVLGMEGVLLTIQESVFSLSDSNLVLETVFGVVEVVCGLMILLGLLTPQGGSMVRISSLIVLLLWLARIVYTKIIRGITLVDGSISFTPELPAWLLIIAVELVVASALGVMYRVSSSR